MFQEDVFYQLARDTLYSFRHRILSEGNELVLVLTYILALRTMFKKIQRYFAEQARAFYHSVRESHRAELYSYRVSNQPEPIGLILLSSIWKDIQYFRFVELC